MKLPLSLIASLALPLLAAPAVQAEDNGFYVDFNASTVDLDFQDAYIQPGPPGSGKPEFDRLTTLGFAAGYSIGHWALEAEYWQSNGEYDVTVVNAGGIVRDRFDYEEFRVSGVFRTSGQWYVLGKLGLSFPDLDVKSQAIHLNMGDAVIYGIGGGFRFNDNTSVELEVTDTQDDTSAVNLGFRFHF